MIVVHHLENSRSQRILWLLEELGLEYELRHYKRHPKTGLAPPDLKAVHPLGKSPVLTDGDATVAESGAIIEYLLHRYDPDHRLHPAPGTPEALQHSYWLHYAEGSLMPYLLMKLVFERVEKAPLPFFLKPVARGISSKVNQTFLDPNLETHLAFIERSLTATGYFAGAALTGADVQMSFPLEAAASRVGTQKYVKISNFLRNIHARPAYQRAIARGGPYTIMT